MAIWSAKGNKAAVLASSPFLHSNGANDPIRVPDFFPHISLRRITATPLTYLERYETVDGSSAIHFRSGFFGSSGMELSVLHSGYEAKSLPIVGATKMLERVSSLMSVNMLLHTP